MSDSRMGLRLPLLAVLLGFLVLGCGNDVRRKAELARDEAAYLESEPLEEWAREWGVDDTVTPKPDVFFLYVPNDHAVRKRGAKDPFDNPYVIGSIRQGVAVSIKTIELCAEVTKHDPTFWGRHDERVLGLIRAAKNGDLDTVRRLVKTVPDPNIPNRMGDTALVFAMGEGNGEMERILTSHGAVLAPGDGSPLWRAIDEDNVKVVKALLDRFPYMATATNAYVWPDGISRTCQLALCKASRVGNMEVVRMLLEHGADLNTLDGRPLWLAVHSGHTDIVRMLVEAGAQITSKALNEASPEIRKYFESQLNRATNGVSSGGSP